MKLIFQTHYTPSDYPEDDFTPVDLQKSIEKTRRDLEIAYAGFNNAIEVELIDSYIYEINALQKRYNHLVALALETAESDEEAAQNRLSYKHSPIRALVSHVFS